VGRGERERSLQCTLAGNLELWYNKKRHIMTRVDLTQIKQKVLPILKEASVTRSSLFGSYVRGEQKGDSDIDLLVDFPRGKGLFEFAGLQLKLEDALKKKVDLVEYASLHPFIRERILAEQIQIL
jgi:uncharacterized protein